MLKDYQQRKEEKQMQDKMETEMMAEYLEEKFGGKEEAREKNFEALLDQVSRSWFADKFDNLIKQAEEVKEEMYQDTFER